MAEINPATGKSWEDEARELKVVFTQKSQQLAEIERLKAEGQLVEKASYDEHVKNWARDNPAEALDWLQLQNQRPDASDVNGGAQTENPWSGFDDSIFDPTSEAHKKFVQEHGDSGLRQAHLAKLAPELLRVTGLDRTIGGLQDELKMSRDEIAALREQSEQAHKYSVAAFDQGQLLADPRRADVRKLITDLEADKTKWFDIVQKIKRADELEEKLRSIEADKSTPAQAAAAQSPEQVAARIERASVVPQGAGSGPGDAISRSIDPFDAAVLKHAPQLAGQYGLPAA